MPEGKAPRAAGDAARQLGKRAHELLPAMRAVAQAGQRANETVRRWAEANERARRKQKGAGRGTA